MLVEVFLKYVCLCCFWGKNGIESAIQRGYVYIWNCGLIVQKAYSSSTQLTRLKIQINTQITKNLITKSLTPKIIKNHSIPLFDKLPYLSHFQTNKKTILEQSQLKTQNPYSYHTLRQTTTHSTLTFILKT